MASVSFEQATRRYPGTDRPALDRLDLIVGDGEFVVLVGPSGCGKTTSLRMVAGLETLDCGRIRIGERDVTEVDPKDRDVAMVFQNYALYPHMTVAQNMGFALKVAKIGKAEIRERCLPQRNCLICNLIWIASRKISPAANGNGWRWVVRSCGAHRYS